MGRSIAALFALAFFFTTAAHAERGSGRAGTRAHLDFAVVVASVVRATTLINPTAFVVGEADVARGYIDLDSATTLSVTSNSPSGFQLAVRFDPRIVARVGIRLAGGPLDVPGPEGSIHVESPKLVDELVAIGYRIYLPPGVGPGTYPWPVRLQLSVDA